MPATRLLSPALALVLGVSLPAAAQDDPLDKLLEEIQQGSKPSAATPDDAKAGDAKADGEKESKPAGELGDEEEDVDKLLEGLIGPRTDRPDASGSAPDDIARDAMPDVPDRLGDDARDDLDQDDQAFDDYLRKLLGRIEPPKEQDQREQQSEEGGPLSETMKKMREVEKRLAELDTGGQTREQQEQIVKDFDQLLRQIRQMQQQQQRQQQRTEMAGNQPQQQQQQDPDGESNNEQTGSPPKTPEQNPALVNAKDSWGHLQDSLREVMGNVSRMMPLDGKKDLIERYFLSVARESIER